MQKSTHNYEQGSTSTKTGAGLNFASWKKISARKWQMDLVKPRFTGSFQNPTVNPLIPQATPRGQLPLHFNNDVDSLLFKLCVHSGGAASQTPSGDSHRANNRAPGAFSSSPKNNYASGSRIRRNHIHHIKCDSCASDDKSKRLPRRWKIKNFLTFLNASKNSFKRGRLQSIWILKLTKKNNKTET